MYTNTQTVITKTLRCTHTHTHTQTHTHTLYLALSEQLLIITKHRSDFLPGNIFSRDDIDDAGEPPSLAHVQTSVGRETRLKVQIRERDKHRSHSPHVILACARELVTTAMKSSPSVLGMSSQYTASPVAWLMAERCMMGRPTGSWALWSFDTCWWRRRCSPFIYSKCGTTRPWMRDVFRPGTPAGWAGCLWVKDGSSQEAHL